MRSDPPTMLKRLLLLWPGVLAVLIAACLGTSLEGCGDDSEQSSFDESCSICVNDTPVGPNSSQAACTAWGAAYGCASATLTNAGVCDAELEDNASCAVVSCSENPAQGCEAL